MAEIETIIAEIEKDLTDFLRRHKGGDISPAQLRELAQASQSTAVQMFLAQYATTPSNVLENVYAQASGNEVLCLLAKHPHFNSKYLRQLAVHEDESVRLAVASSRCITPQTALALCGDDSAMVRAALARNSMIPARVQVQLSEDSVPFVRAALLAHSQLDSEVCAALAEDTDPTVQAAALLAQKTPEETLLFWADSDEHFPQSIILKRKKIPDKVLESLCFSSHPDVKLNAISRKELTADEKLGFANDEDERIRLKIAKIPNLPDYVQEKLAVDESKAVRLALAACPSLAPEAAEKLIENADQEMILALASNPGTPEEIIGQLAEKGGGEVLQCLVDRECPQAVLDKIYASGDEATLYHLAYNGFEPAGMGAELASRLAESRLPTLRAFGAMAESCPLYIVARLARDPSWVVRAAVARSKAANDSTREILAADSDQRVRNAVKAAAKGRQIQTGQ